MKQCKDCHAPLLSYAWSYCNPCTNKRAQTVSKKRTRPQAVSKKRRRTLSNGKKKYVCVDCLTKFTREYNSVKIHPETCDSCHQAKVLRFYTQKHLIDQVLE